jgi:hypothetical protein
LLTGLLCAIAIVAPAERLSRVAVPEHYAIHLAPDFATDTFAGQVAISVRLSEPTRSVTLHAAEIQFHETTISADGSTRQATVSLDAEKETATLTVGRELPAGPATIAIRYTGILNDRLRGLYLSRGNNREYAVTQLEATDARRAFPSFDEPALKATFALSATIDNGDTAISNGRVLSDTPGPGAGKHTLRFATTQRMSTYVVAMLVGVFLIYHTVETAVLNRREELLTLWTLGAPRPQLVTHLLIEVALVGIVGCALGIGAGVGFARLATGAFTEVVSNMYAPIPEPRIAIGWGEVALALGFGLSAVLVGALVPCVRAFWPREHTSKSGYSIAAGAVLGLFLIGLGRVLASFAHVSALWGRVGLVGAFAALVFAGTTLLVPFILAAASPLLRFLLRGGWDVLGTWIWGQLRRRPGHTAVTMGALAAGTAFALGMATLLGSYRHAFVEWIGQAFTADVFVNAGSNVSLLGGPTIGPEVAGNLAGVPGVRRVMRWRLVEVAFAGQPIIVQAMSEELIDRAHAGARLNHAAGDVVISDTLAERYSLSQGDRLTLAAPQGPLTVRVASVAPDYVIDLGNVKIGWDLFVRHFGEQGANVLLVDASPGTSGGQLKDRLEEALGDRYDITVLTQAELHALLDRLIDQSFALTRSLEFLAVLVVVCAMVNATSAAIVERSDELVTLRALACCAADSFGC